MSKHEIMARAALDVRYGGPLGKMIHGRSALDIAEGVEEMIAAEAALAEAGYQIVPVEPTVEIERLRARVAELERGQESLKEMARLVIQEGAWEGLSIDGGTIQDEAERLGLIRAEIYDPEKHGAEYAAEFVAGEDTIFVFTGPLAAAKDD